MVKKKERKKKKKKKMLSLNVMFLVYVCVLVHYTFFIRTQKGPQRHKHIKINKFCAT